MESSDSDNDIFLTQTKYSQQQDDTEVLFDIETPDFRYQPEVEDITMSDTELENIEREIQVESVHIDCANDLRVTREDVLQGIEQAIDCRYMHESGGATSLSAFNSKKFTGEYNYILLELFRQ